VHTYLMLSLVYMLVYSATAVSSACKMLIA
jgi:hypothetical protein